MTTIPEPVTRPAWWGTESIKRLLRVFDDCKNAHAMLSARSISGISSTSLRCPLPARDVPLAALHLLISEHSLRIAPAPKAGEAYRYLPLLWCLWRPASEFSHGTGWRHTVTEDARAAIATALAGMPPPSIHVEAGPEVWAGWRLIEPIDLRAQGDQAREFLRELAQRLGGDVERPQDFAVDLPVAGVVRNWNGSTPDLIEIVTVEPTRRYPITELLKEGTR
jgi:hypothetical protein